MRYIIFVLMALIIPNLAFGQFEEERFWGRTYIGVLSADGRTVVPVRVGTPLPVNVMGGNITADQGDAGSAEEAWFWRLTDNNETDYLILDVDGVASLPIQTQFLDENGNTLIPIARVSAAELDDPGLVVRIASLPPVDIVSAPDNPLWCSLAGSDEELEIIEIGAAGSEIYVLGTFPIYDDGTGTPLSPIAKEEAALPTDPGIVTHMATGPTPANMPDTTIMDVLDTGTTCIAGSDAKSIAIYNFSDVRLCYSPVNAADCTGVDLDCGADSNILFLEKGTAIPLPHVPGRSWAVRFVDAPDPVTRNFGLMEWEG